MKTYYCAMTEFYGDGSVKTGFSSRAAKEMPKSQFKETPISDCYVDWFETENEARSFLKEAGAA